MIFKLGSSMTKNLMFLVVICMFSFVNFGCTDTKEAEKLASSPSAEPAIEAVVPISSELEAPKWIEGTHYNIISDEVSEKKEVVEYFSFWCPACYRFEPIVNRIKSGLAEDVSFRKVHVNFMSFTTPEIQDEATKAMLVARQMGNENLLNAAIFAHIHEQGKKIESMNDLKQLFISYDISEADFNRRLNDTALSDELSQNNNEIIKFKEHVKSVPNIIVNGKYQATFTREMTTIQDIVDLVNWLGQQD